MKTLAFLSYTHADRVAAERLWRELSTSRAHVWADWLKIDSPRDWKQEVYTALLQSSEFHVLDSHAYRKSPSCVFEFKLATTLRVPKFLVSSNIDSSWPHEDEKRK